MLENVRVAASAASGDENLSTLDVRARRQRIHLWITHVSVLSTAFGAGFALHVTVRMQHLLQGLRSSRSL